jgi:hypothetical protein
MSDRINVPAFVNAVRPSNPEALTPADLQPFILFLTVEAAQLQPLLLELKGITWSSEKLRQIEQIQRDLDLYDERLAIYLEHVNEEIAHGEAGSSLAAQSVVGPLLRGRYPTGHRLPGGNPDVLCGDADVCYDSVPDIATIAILRNALTEFDVLDRYQQIQFLRDVEEETKKVLGEIATPNLFRLAALLPETPTSNPTSNPLRWATIGAVGALGVLAAYKLLK